MAEFVNDELDSFGCQWTSGFELEPGRCHVGCWSSDEGNTYAYGVA
ncbi:MAG: hypothetical protein NWE99_03595 [Candidatus Bathyarchaeota archaeon]|nr:hypothetical protein [Candidatus Bathyarchaeota archaeon]